MSHDIQPVSDAPPGATRLRSKTLSALSLAIGLNAFVLFARGTPTERGWPWVGELIGSAILAYAMHNTLIRRRIDGNIFHQAPLTKARRHWLLVFCAGSLLVGNIRSLRDWILATPLPNVILYSVLFSTVLSLVWLVRYERRTGAVYIIEERTPTA